MASKIRSIERAREKHEAKEAQITVKLSELFESSTALQVLMNQPFPATQAFALMRLAKIIKAELDTLNETRTKLLEQYGKLNEEKTEYEFSSKAKRVSFEKEWSDLISVDVTIKGQTLTLDSLRGMNISPAHLLSLGWLITE